MDVSALLVLFTLLGGFYMSWNIGANDVANAMGTSVGSKALTLKKAVFLAAILEFGGAFFIGSPVSQTIQHEIVDPSFFASQQTDFALGMLGALLATGLLLQAASYYGLPLSTTHAIVGAVVGFGLIAGGPESIKWIKIAEIGASWIFSPLLSAAVSYALFSLIQKRILYALNPLEATQKLAPYFFFACFFLISWSLLYGGLIQINLNLSLSTAVSICSSISVLGAFFGSLAIRRSLPQLSPATASTFQPQQAVSLEKALHHLQRVYLSNQNLNAHGKIATLVHGVRELCDEAKKSAPFSHSKTYYLGVEKSFILLQIMSACLVAFAHGANDVANAIGPMNAILTSLFGGTSLIPSWLLAFGGAGIVLGLATWGWRVIETIGEKITELTPTRGFAAEFGAATTILLASKLGLPVSTTHALVGAVFGVGMARGLQALNLKTLKEIVASWIVTLPLCALLSMGVYLLLRYLF